MSQKDRGLTRGLLRGLPWGVPEGVPPLRGVGLAKGGPHDDGDDDDVVVNSTVDWCCEGERRRAFVGSAAAVAGFLWAGLPRAGPRAHEVLRKGELGCGFRLPKTSRCGTFVTCASGGEVVESRLSTIFKNSTMYWTLCGVGPAG